MTDESRALVKASGVVTTLSEIERAAGYFAKSGYFKDTKDAAQAVAKIMYGMEMGIGPASAMQSVYIIEGKPAIAATAMATAIKRSGVYNYRVNKLDDNGCSITFYERGAEVGSSEFSRADAEKAQLLNKDNWRKFPRNMYFARAISNGARWYTPDIFGGAAVYTPDELEVEVDEDGSPKTAVIDSQPHDDRTARDMRRFWARVTELGYPNKKAAHIALGVEPEEGALGAKVYEEWDGDWQRALDALENIGPYTASKSEATPSGHIIDSETAEIIESPASGLVAVAEAAGFEVIDRKPAEESATPPREYPTKLNEDGLLERLPDEPEHLPYPGGPSTTGSFVALVGKHLDLIPSDIERILGKTWRDNANPAKFPEFWARLQA